MPTSGWTGGLGAPIACGGCLLPLYEERERERRREKKWILKTASVCQMRGSRISTLSVKLSLGKLSSCPSDRNTFLGYKDFPDTGVLLVLMPD